MRSRIAVLALATLLLPTFARAQDGYSKFRFLPTVGVHVPLGELSRVYEDTVLSVRLGGGTVLGFAIEYDRVLDDVDLRLGVSYAPGAGLFARDVERWEACGPSCEEPVFGESSDAIGRSSLLLVTGDFVLRPLSESQIRTWKPYLLVGGGLRYNDFRQDALDAVARQTFASDETGWMFHLGGGVDVHTGPAVVSVEASDHLSIYDHTAKLYNRVTGEEGLRRESRLHHDIVVALGLRFAPFW